MRRVRVRLPGSGPLTDPIPDIDIAALAYDAARRALADFWWEVGRSMNLNVAERLTAGKVVGGSLSAEPADGTGSAKAPPPADGPGNPEAPESTNSAILAPPGAPGISLSVDEARAALEAAQDREDAVRGERVMGRLAEGTLTPATVKALGAKWPMPKSARFGEPDSSLQARLMKAGTIAVGRWCRTHSIREGE